MRTSARCGDRGSDSRYLFPLIGPDNGYSAWLGFVLDEDSLREGPRGPPGGHGVTFWGGYGRVDAYFCRQILTDIKREKQAQLLSDSVKAHYLEIAGVDLGRWSEPIVAPEDSQYSIILESLVAMGFATVRAGRVYVMQETWVSFDAENKERLTREAFPDFFGQVYDYRSGRRLASFDPFLGFRIH